MIRSQLRARIALPSRRGADARCARSWRRKPGRFFIRSCDRKIGDLNYKVHLDGYDLTPALKGEAAWPRNEFIYWTDDGSVAALRYNNWKLTFLQQKAEGMDVWIEPFTQLRAPIITNLRMDPFERAKSEHAVGYQLWFNERMFMIAPAAGYVGQWLQSFREFPPRMKPGSFSLDRVMETVSKPKGGN
jgi:arylsulfatase